MLCGEPGLREIHVRLQDGRVLSGQEQERRCNGDNTRHKLEMLQRSYT